MHRNQRDHRGAVVVTGASTGIGAATAIHLAGKGFRVFAGVRREEDGDALTERTSGDVTQLIIDVTDEETISTAVETVGTIVGERGLAGLVNNAGIVKPAPIECQPIADFREQLEVNLVGHVAVTQAFLPLIRRGPGRTVNVGSIRGRLVLPIHGASASKFGTEALSDALRLELRQWSIPDQPSQTASAAVSRSAGPSRTRRPTSPSRKRNTPSRSRIRWSSSSNSGSSTSRGS